MASVILPPPPRAAPSSSSSSHVPSSLEYVAGVDVAVSTCRGQNRHGVVDVDVSWSKSMRRGGCRRVVVDVVWYVADVACLKWCVVDMAHSRRGAWWTWHVVDVARLVDVARSRRGT